MPSLLVNLLIVWLIGRFFRLARLRSAQQTSRPEQPVAPLPRTARPRKRGLQGSIPQPGVYTEPELTAPEIPSMVSAVPVTGNVLQQERLLSQAASSPDISSDRRSAGANRTDSLLVRGDYDALVGSIILLPVLGSPRSKEPWARRG